MKFRVNRQLDKPSTEEEHKQVNRQLQSLEERQREMARRLRVLEIEAGIYKPEIRRVS